MDFSRSGVDALSVARSSFNTSVPGIYWSDQTGPQRGGSRTTRRKMGFGQIKQTKILQRPKFFQAIELGRARCTRLKSIWPMQALAYGTHPPPLPDSSQLDQNPICYRTLTWVNFDVCSVSVLKLKAMVPIHSARKPLPPCWMKDFGEGGLKKLPNNTSVEFLAMGLGHVNHTRTYAEKLQVKR